MSPLWLHAEAGPAAVSYDEIPPAPFERAHVSALGVAIGVAAGVAIHERVILYGALDGIHAWNDGATFDAASLSAGAIYLLRPGLYGGLGAAAMVFDWESAAERRAQGGLAPGFSLRAGKEWALGPDWTIGVEMVLETSLRQRADGSREYDERWGTLGLLFSASR